MSERIDFVEKPTSFVSIEKLSELKNAETFELDHFYLKTNRKKKLKFTKLNFDNYQN